MNKLTRTQMLQAAIRNEAWLVRHYRRNRILRAQAVQKLGITIREAFIESDDHEALLIAIIEGLKPQDYEPPF